LRAECHAAAFENARLAQSQQTARPTRRVVAVGHRRAEQDDQQAAFIAHLDLVEPPAEPGDQRQRPRDQRLQVAPGGQGDKGRGESAELAHPAAEARSHARHDSGGQIGRQRIDGGGQVAGGRRRPGGHVPGGGWAQWRGPGFRGQRAGEGGAGGDPVEAQVGGADDLPGERPAAHAHAQRERVRAGRGLDHGGQPGEHRASRPRRRDVVGKGGQHAVAGEFDYVAVVGMDGGNQRGINAFQGGAQLLGPRRLGGQGLGQRGEALQIGDQHRSRGGLAVTDGQRQARPQPARHIGRKLPRQEVGSGRSSGINHGISSIA
jgi:hypothetical protein